MKDKSGMLRVSLSIKILCVVALTSAPIAVSASVLDRVLELAAVLYPQFRAASLTANIAENAGSISTGQKILDGGDRVVIGYNVSGAPVFAVAGSMGLLVTPADAATLASGGVAAGLYPVGSALYAIPPSGQLSIFNQTASGILLDQARTSYMTRIDGSITNIISAIYPPEISQIAALEAGVRGFDFGSMGSTALGAVNAGQIVTEIQVLSGVDALGLNGIDLARLGRGPNISFDYASTDMTSSLSNRIAQMGGNRDTSTLAINLASNGTDVTGRVTNIVSGVNGSVIDIVTTALGAVNGGAISN